jgi:hypothetical protein
MIRYKYERIAIKYRIKTRYFECECECECESEPEPELEPIIVSDFQPSFL